MADEEITLYYNRLRLDAIKEALGNQSQAVSEELYATLDALYESVVPAEKRADIENTIVEDLRRAEEAKEAARKFSLIHVRENGMDSYFASDIFQSFHAAAYRYRLYSRQELDSTPHALAEAFIGSEKISERQYENLLEQMPADHRIMVALDFDLDEKQVTVCDPMSDEQKAYSLHDVSVAAYKAFRGDYHTSAQRAEMFADALDGKELEIDAPEMQM